MQWPPVWWYSRRFAYTTFFVGFAALAVLAFTSLGDCRSARAVDAPHKSIDENDPLGFNSPKRVSFDDVVAAEAQRLSDSWYQGLWLGVLAGAGVSGAGTWLIMLTSSKCRSCGVKRRGVFCSRCGAKSAAAVVTP